jgi:ribosomal protein L18E
MLGGDWTPPAAPERPGYTAEWYIQSGDTWVKWNEYKLEDGSSKLMAKIVYTPTVYTAKFFADGKLVGTTNFTVEDSKLSKIPAVPAKAGFTGVWSDFKIGPGDLEIHAIYTAIEEPAHPLEGKDFLLFVDGFVGGLYDSDPDGLHWIWWLIILILLVLIIITLIILLVVLKRKKNDTPPEEPETDPEPVIVPEPEDEEPEEEEPEVEEILDTVDVQTADELMTDTVAMAVLETVGGAKAAGMKSIINISKINESFEANDTVDIDTLKAKKLISAKTERFKVLGDGHLDKPLTVVADSFSIQAIKMITLTGGKAIQKKSEK